MLLSDEARGGPSSTRLKCSGAKRFTRIDTTHKIFASEAISQPGPVRVHTSTFISTSPKASQKVRRQYDVLDDRPTKRRQGSPLANPESDNAGMSNDKDDDAGGEDACLDGMRTEDMQPLSGAHEDPTLGSSYSVSQFARVRIA